MSGLKFAIIDPAAGISGDMLLGALAPGGRRTTSPESFMSRPDDSRAHRRTRPPGRTIAPKESE